MYSKSPEIFPNKLIYMYFVYINQSHSMNLPTEVISKIMEYSPVMKYRHGRWMNRISPEDVRYSVLKKIPRKAFVSPVIHAYSDTTLVNFYDDRLNIKYCLYVYTTHFTNEVKYTFYKSYRDKFFGGQTYYLK
jgi:hypothetical protein